MIYETLLLLAVLHFLVFVVLTVAVVTDRRVSWGTKGSTIVFALIIGATSFDLHGRIVGYPAPLDLPEKFRLLQFAIVEPTTTDAGAIYLWVVAEHDDQPRAFERPYNRPDHEKLEEARGKLAQGEAVYMGQSEEQTAELRTGESVVTYGIGGRFQPLDFIAPPNTVPEK